MATAVKVFSNFAADRAFTMEAAKEIRIIDHLTNNCGIASDDAEQIYNVIIKAFNAGQHVVLDFAGIEWLIDYFIDEAIGKLYEVYTSAQLKEMLEFRNLSPSISASLRQLEEHMNLYLSDPEQYNMIMEDAIYGTY